MPDRENENAVGGVFTRLRLMLRDFEWLPRVSLVGFLGILLFLAAMAWVIFTILTR